MEAKPIVGTLYSWDTISRALDRLQEQGVVTFWEHHPPYWQVGVVGATHGGMTAGEVHALLTGIDIGRRSERRADIRRPDRFTITEGDRSFEVEISRGGLFSTEVDRVLLTSPSLEGLKTKVYGAVRFLEGKL